MYYRLGGEDSEYQPDFVAETKDAIFMIEAKRASDLSDADVIAKREAAVKWCHHASGYTATYGGKPLRYLLIPHDAVADNMTIEGLAARFEQT